MESYSLSHLTKKLLESGITLISSQTLKNLLDIKSERTYYRIINEFVKNNILINIERNKYYLTGKNVDTFEIANFFYQPSYISLETALNYWGVLSQFPFEITSITSKKSVKKNFDDKMFNYSHIAPKYFGMFVKKNNFLIALPEKALFDQLYLTSKGLKSISLDEYDFKKINLKTFFNICNQLKADQSIIDLVKKNIK